MNKQKIIWKHLSIKGKCSLLLGYLIYGINGNSKIIIDRYAMYCVTNHIQAMIDFEKTVAGVFRRHSPGGR